MKRLFFIFTLLLLPLAAMAQQVQIEKRSQTPCLYPEFKEAKI